VNRIEIWQDFVEKFFSETGAFVLVVTRPDRTKQLDIVAPALPRYFWSQFNFDINHLQITLDGATEKTSGLETKVTCDRAKFIYTYKNDVQVWLDF
jgi:hypothetical protein